MKKFLLLLIIISILSADIHAQYVEQPHLSDYELLAEAGFFHSGLYWGGAPNIHKEQEWYTCETVCSPKGCPDTRNNVTSKATFCFVWQTREASTNLAATGTCKCTKKSSNLKFCQAYFCDQSVDVTHQICDDDNSCGYYTTTYGKYKDCNCDYPSANGDYCQAWTCIGYGDGSVKTANWKCNAPSSQVNQANLSHDFCWYFQSDQYSTSVREAKDCKCVDDATDYCSRWHCSQMDTPIWGWWTPILASLLGAALNLWVPFVVWKSSDPGIKVCVIVWAVMSYLVIVLVGGVPSLVANSGVLILVSVLIIVYENRGKCKAHHHKPKPAATTSTEISVEIPPPAIVPQPPATAPQFQEMTKITPTITDTV